MDGTILISDDDRTIRTVLTQAFTRAGCKVHATSSLVTLLRWVQEGKGDLVISDVVMPDGNGLETLPKISALRPELPVIIISAQNNIMTAIQATEADAYDYLPKPFDLPDLMKRSARALNLPQRSRAASQEIPAQELPLVGKTDAMQALYRLIARVMNTDLPVLISGESGSGKSLIARAMHDFSDRRSRPYIIATSTDLETTDRATGLASRAQGGTLLFDEVGDLNADVQARIVRLMDTFSYDAPRVMATSQADLAEKLSNGTIRSDLFYRLSGVTIQVPPLRERVDDIELLAKHFLAKSQREDLTQRTFSHDAIASLRQFSWPGNVRQLENMIYRLAVTSSDFTISNTEVQTALHSQPTVGNSPDLAGDERLTASIEKHLRRYFDLHGGTLPPPGLYPRILREMEHPLISIALEATGGNQAKCADLLGINRNTLRKKITELDIRVTRRRKLM